MLLFLEMVDIVAIILMLFILAVILGQQSSKAQTAFILYNIFTIMFIVGIHLELIHSDTVGEALAGLCVQYVGQAGLLMSLLWFVSEFARFSVPAWVYGLEAACNAVVLAGVFSAEKHRLFYDSMRILTDGMYNRIEVGRGVLWHLHYIHLYLVVFSILFLCAVKYRGSTPVQKKRITYIAAGIGSMAALLILKIAGVFGSYNPIVVAMAFNTFCMMMAMVRYSYFDSLHAAVDNAFNHGNEGLIILDGEDMVVFANHRIKELFPNIRTGSVIGGYEEIQELMDGEEHLLYRDGAACELRMEDIIEHGEKNGRMLWFVDQTQQLLNMQKLREADEAKTRFLMNVSHELRTPMNTMLGMNEMILRESGDETIISYAREVAGAGAHMLSLINEVLDASRLESGAVTIAKTAYQIDEVLKKAEELTRPQAEGKGLSFTVWAESGLTKEGRFLSGDPAHILQILVNLLSNAVKYTDSGFVCLEAKSQWEDGAERLLLSVRDSGIGICEKDQARIFESFARASNVGHRDGMGLGLAIAKQLAEAMGGELTVESTPKEGSTFTVALPWEEAAVDQPAAWKEQEGEEWNIADFHTKMILAVDDDERNLMVLKHLLKRTKAAVETAPDGESAVKACTRKKYDLLLLDHMMPEMDGIDTLHAIRQDKDGKNQDTMAVALTANAGKGAEQMYLSKGFAGYLSKPVAPKRLEQMLESCFGMEDQAGWPGSETAEKRRQGGERWPVCLEQNGIRTQEGMRYADYDEAFYQELLVLFAEQQERKQQRLSKLFEGLENQKMQEEKASWDTWVVFCHGLKGEARGLGASELGECFYRLELAGRGKDKEKIKEIYPHAVKEWEKAVAGIRQAFPFDCSKGQGQSVRR